MLDRFDIENADRYDSEFELHRSYDRVCPVCRKTHTVRADFLSSPRHLLAADGRSLPSESCGAHSAEELRRTWRLALGEISPTQLTENWRKLEAQQDAAQRVEP
jgi:hypothetical protein